MFRNLLDIAYQKATLWKRPHTQRVSAVHKNSWTVSFPDPGIASRLRGFISPTEVLPNLFIGSCMAAMDKQFVDTMDLVVNVSTEIPNYFDGQLPYINIVLDDINAQTVPDMRVSILEIVRVLRAGGKVLIHCFAGRSRSAMVTLLTMMEIDPSLSVADAYIILKSKRDCVAINTTFYNYINDNVKKNA